jgi:hypothetical protein
MYSTSSKLNEIILLNRKLRNALSFRGGSTQKLQNFKSKLNQNKLSILYIYIIVFSTILFLTPLNLPQNKKITGGAVNYSDLGSVFDDIKGKYDEIIKELISQISEVIDDVHNQILEATKEAGGPVVDGINTGIDALGSNLNTLLYSQPMIPWVAPLIFILSMLSTINYFYTIICFTIMGLSSAAYAFSPIQVPIIPTAIVYSILIYLVCMCLIDVKIYLPCYGCDTGTTFYKCLPGTGKGSVGCTVYTEFLRKIKFILKSITAIKSLILNFKKKILSVFNKLISFIFIFSDLFYKVFGSSIEKIFNALRFLKRLEIPDEWGFNFGEFIICPDFSTKGNDCIYNKDGSLRNRHGNNPIFHTFWKMIRVVLELPPPMPKFKMGGGKKFEFDNIETPEVTQPTIKKQEDIETPVTEKGKKNSYDKNIAYKKLLETLIKIEINPIKWIAALFNILIDAINFIIEKNIKLLKKIVSFIFSLITEAVKGMTKVFGKIINLLLKPLNEVANIALKLPKQLFKAISKIFEIGPFTIITFYFYKMLTSLFPFLDKLRSFMIIITIVIIIQSILVICPMIGGLYAFYVPFMYVYGIYKTINGYIKNYNTIFVDLNKTLIENNDVINQIKDYLLDLDDFYKIVIGSFIFILIVFIILNLFTDFNRRFTKWIIRTVTRLVYGHYYNKFSEVQKKFIRFKIETENRKEKENKENNIKSEEIKKVNKTYVQRLNDIRNLSLTDFNNIY